MSMAIDAEANREKARVFEKKITALEATCARLSEDVNNLDHGLHKHSDPHWLMWERVNGELKKRVIALEAELKWFCEEHEPAAIELAIKTLKVELMSQMWG